MRLALTPHLDFPSPDVLAIRVEAVRGPGSSLKLSFELTGNIDALRVPEPGSGERTDGLWQGTCFEAFLRSSGDPYLEINLAPSGDWAVYRFGAYRAGMLNAELPNPSIKTIQRRDMLKLEGELVLPLPATAAWHLALAAVIEGKDGDKSYWALAHPSGKPDFHHRDCFAAELPAPSAS